MNRSKSLSLIPVSLLLLLAGCKKNTIKASQLSLLPPATQTGANTFGCLVNGRAFVPKNQNILQAPILQCQYGYSNGGYSFEAAGGNKNSDGSLTDIIVRTDSLTTITEGKAINFKTNTAGNASAAYYVLTVGYLNDPLYVYGTNNSVSGQLTITRLDPVKHFVSGTFYFNAVNSVNDTVKVTNGRFDMPFN
jgi:hypothetical protein